MATAFSTKMHLCTVVLLSLRETWLGGALLLSSTYDHGIYIFFGCVFMSMEKCIRKDELYHNGMALFLKKFCANVDFNNEEFQLKFMFSKKATKLGKIFTVDLTLT